jgi:hypothetical protein
MSKKIYAVGILLLVSLLGYFGIGSFINSENNHSGLGTSPSNFKKGTSTNMVKGSSADLGVTGAAPLVQVPHVLPPTQLKSLYMTSWVAGTPSLRDRVIGLLDSTEANALVIDIKDYSGKIAFKTGDTVLDNGPCIEERVKDMKGLVQKLHDKGIYVIGRVAVFQDPCFVGGHPESAVKRKTDGKIWKDKKGISWVDMSSEVAWKYVVQIAKASYELGFDEINFDYVRFPSDGDMKNIVYLSGQKPKPEVFKSFFTYLDKELRGGKGWYKKDDYHGVTSTGTSTSVVASTTIEKKMQSGLVMTTMSNLSGTAEDSAFDAYWSLVHSTSTEWKTKRDGAIQNKTGVGRLITSADLFGMVTTQPDDLGIGQILEYALPYVDHIYPMVYPSHYPANWNGFKNPATKPYEVVKISMDKAVERTKHLGLNEHKLMPWIQDFNLGATYTADMVKAQFKATYDAGLSGWLIWNAANKYTKGALGI